MRTKEEIINDIKIAESELRTVWEKDKIIRDNIDDLMFDLFVQQGLFELEFSLEQYNRGRCRLYARLPESLKFIESISHLGRGKLYDDEIEFLYTDSTVLFGFESIDNVVKFIKKHKVKYNFSKLRDEQTKAYQRYLKVTTDLKVAQMEIGDKLGTQ